MGEHRDKFNTASEVKMYAGIAPVTERSGKKCWLHWRWQCSKLFVQSSYDNPSSNGLKNQYQIEFIKKMPEGKT